MKRAIKLTRIVSGGQTGADRAALDWAIGAGIPHGGWCPHGRRAEDGAIPPQYQLIETPSSNYVFRTGLNIRDSDGTVIFSCNRKISGGTALTLRLATEQQKPLLHLYQAHPSPVLSLQDFVLEYDIKNLNVAGPRESKEPEIYDWVTEILTLAFSTS